MFRKVAFAGFVVLFSMAFVMADEFNGTITKVDGNKISLTKKAKKGEKGEEMVLEVIKDVKVVKGKFNKDEKKFEAGDAIADGLKSEIFSKNVGVRVTTNDDKKVTQIMVLGGKKKKVQ